MKTDSSIKNICIAAVKRHTIKPIDFPLTSLFDEETTQSFLNQINLGNGELLISQTYIDKTRWTLVTSRRIISCIDSDIQETFADKVISWRWDNFKEVNKSSTTVGRLELENNRFLNIYLETGQASMITIYSIMTLVRQIKKQL